MSCPGNEPGFSTKGHWTRGTFSALEQQKMHAACKHPAPRQAASLQCRIMHGMRMMASDISTRSMPCMLQAHQHHDLAGALMNDAEEGWQVHMTSRHQLPDI